MWLLRSRSIGIEIADKKLIKSSSLYSNQISAFNLGINGDGVLTESKQEPNPQSRKFQNASENRGEIWEKRSLGSSFWKTHFRIKNTDILYGRSYEDVCNEVFYCRSNHGIISFNCCIILGWNRFLRELRR
jgi:hypothetical protein